MATVYRVKITAIDPHFAPSVERLDIQYSVLPDGLTASEAKLEVFRKGNPGSAIYSDETITKSGIDIAYEQNGTNGWDGKDGNGKWITPVDSEYTVKITASMVDGYGPASDTETTQVLVHSLAFNCDSAARIIMNDPNNKEEIAVTVKLKKKDGSGAVTAVPVNVRFSFFSPEMPDTAKDDSYEYNPGQFLGKRNDPNAVYWAGHASSDSQSDDSYKLECKAQTVTTAGDNQGKAYIWFKPSGVGGDEFQIWARVMGSEQSLISKKSGVLTVWRRIEFDYIYQMDGLTHVADHVGGVQNRFDPAFVEFVAGSANPIPPGKSVKYIGLWKNDGDHQLDWQEIQTRKAEEIPTQEELDAAGDPQHPQHAAAHEAIKMKAQAWADRIGASFDDAMHQWRTNSGLPNHSVIAINYMHPKYSEEAGEWQTQEEWPDWVMITVPHFPHQQAQPDEFWTNAGGIALNGTHAVVPKDTSSVISAIAHEAAHISWFGPPKGFHRAKFGLHDHSIQAGLMHPEGTQPLFSTNEKKILRGIKVGGN